MKRTHWILTTAVAALLATPLLYGQPRRDTGNNPALGVARLGLADGDVTVQRGGAGARMQALGGRALVAEDVLATGRGSRAEVQFDTANFARLGPETELRILDLGNRSYRFEVVKGMITYSQLEGGEADVSMQVHETSIRPLKVGVYRIAVRDTGQLDVTARKGSAEVFSPDGIHTLKHGKRMIIRTDGQNVQYQTVKAARKDGFDEWAERRDKMMRREPQYAAWGYPYFGFGYGYPYWGFGLGYGWGSYWPGAYYAPRTRVIVRNVPRGGGGGGIRGGGGRRR